MGESELKFYAECFRGFSKQELLDVAKHEGDFVSSNDDFHTALRTVLAEVSEAAVIGRAENVTLVEPVTELA